MYLKGNTKDRTIMNINIRKRTEKKDSRKKKKKNLKEKIKAHSL